MSDITRQFRYRTDENGKEVVEIAIRGKQVLDRPMTCLLYTSPSPRDS